MTNTKKFPKWLGITIAVILCVSLIVGWKVYQVFLGASVTETQKYLYIHTNDTYENVLRRIRTENIVKDADEFDYVAKAMSYPSAVKAGKYRLQKGMSNRRLVGDLRGGYQEPVSLRFSNIRLKENFAGFLGRNFEQDSLQFISLLNNEAEAEKYGFTKDNFYTMFIPNTYQIYWNTSADKVIERFHEEYKKFWTAERLEKAKAQNFTPVDASILASIVRGEALHNDEMPMIAGLYLNRLKKGMLLQADPTVIFANNDFTIRRVLNKHLTIDNPYNTYKFKGLPPGPINMPPIVAIDAVLNPSAHKYIYMCAKEDFSGYHAFAETVSEHLVNARKFQKALDERNIKK
ncbi:endolytic transglycosylase MltG [Sphingobacterium bovistauri]|uniref:Endolytic murein transglycosylase n=1 Tax=Sphingobacterium bovistauri TaxID=2781959 RepID=A0ABS7Z7C0_9SPHI|nr:endolytic transglycosylase MltG [Sphingobacterium bovistauri]MCA5006073.1 endolytic transglycosylase MltG [Sphingobacterium bovistauri]